MASQTALWRDFYESAQQQNVVDPAFVTALAIHESGWSAAGRNANLGIDSRGTPGLPGSGRISGANGHQFYTYASGLEAAQSLAAYFQTPIYQGSGILGVGPERMLDIMHQKNYCVDEPGFPCAQFNLQMLQLRAQIVNELGLPSSQQPVPGSGIGGLTPSQGGGNPDPIGGAAGAVGGAVGGAADAVGGAVSGAVGGASSVMDSLGHILGNLRTPAFWWTVLLFGSAAIAVLFGAVLVTRPGLARR